MLNIQAERYEANGEELAVRRGPGRPTRSNAELLDLSLDLFFENGFERTSIDAICASAGMAKRTVYARYGDKAQLFKAALRRAIEQWIVPIERLRAVETGDFEETLMRIARILVANVISPSGLRLMRLTNAESARMPDVGAFSVKLGTEPTLTYLGELFRSHLALGVPESEEAALAFLHLAIGGSGNSAAWGVIGDAESVERHTCYCVRLFLHGLLAEAGASGAANGASFAAVENENLRLKKLLAETMIKLDQAHEGA